MSSSQLISVSPPISPETHFKNFQTIRDTSYLCDLAIDDKSELANKPISSSYGSLKTKVSNLYYGDENAYRIRICITELLHEIDNDPEKFRNKFNTIDIDKIIPIFITEKFIPSGEDWFKPHCLWRMKTIQNMLVPKLGELREKKRKAVEKSLKETKKANARNYSEEKARKKARKLYNQNTPDHKMDIAIAKSDLMNLLNIGIATDNVGSTGSRILSWFDTKKLAIIKTEDKTLLSLKTIINQLKFRAGCQVSLIKNGVSADPRGEIATHIIAEHFNIPITCQTTVIRVNDSWVSFQLWAKGMNELEDIKPILEAESRYTKKTIFTFQLMVILNYFTADVDFYGKNCLIKMAQGTLISYLRKIDNANTFIIRDSSHASGPDVKQYGWRTWNIAKIPFLQEAREIMATMTETSTNEAIKKIHNKLPGYLTTTMTDLSELRREVLEFGSTIPGFSPEELGKRKTSDEMRAFLLKKPEVIPKAKMIISGSLDNIKMMDDYNGSSPNQKREEE